MLSIKNINKTYKDHQALKNIHLEIKKGAIYGLIGHNGAGKTTLIRIITQIIKADSGSISIDGEPLNPNHRHSIGYLPEERGLYKKMALRDYLIFLGNLRAMPISDINKSIDLWLEKFDLVQMQKKEIASLSKGNQQKVQFIATVFFNPKLLILDEPFSGFDPSNAELLKKEILALNRNGVTILFSTHQMEAVEELCQEIAMIDRSEIVLSGNLQEIKKSFGTQEIYVQSKSKLVLPTSFSCHEHWNSYKKRDDFYEVAI